MARTGGVGRRYTVVVSGTASPAATFDLAEIETTGNPLRIRRIRLTQTSESPIEDEHLAVTIIRGHTTSGVGGGTPTASKLNSGEAAPDADGPSKLETMNTTIASAGTPIVLFEDAWHVKEAYDMAFAPDEAIEIKGLAQQLNLRIGGPADAITIRATIWFEEFD